ncbi:hypothetical protein ACEE86_23465, partial [Proteus mirabilis]
LFDLVLFIFFLFFFVCKLLPTTVIQMGTLCAGSVVYKIQFLYYWKNYSLRQLRSNIGIFHNEGAKRLQTA